MCTSWDSWLFSILITSIKVHRSLKELWPHWRENDWKKKSFFSSNMINMPHFVNQHHEISIVIEVQFHLWSQKGLAGKNWRYLTSWVAIGAPRGPYGSLQGPPASPRSKNLRDPELAEGPRWSPRQGRGPPMMVGGRGGTRGIFDWILTGFCCWWAQGGPLSPTPTIWEHFCFLIFLKLAEGHFHISLSFSPCGEKRETYVENIWVCVGQCLGHQRFRFHPRLQEFSNQCC